MMEIPLRDRLPKSLEVEASADNWHLNIKLRTQQEIDAVIELLALIRPLMEQSKDPA